MKTKETRMYDCQRWRKARLRHLNEFPLCALCARQGIDTEATIIDHVVEHKGDYVKFWDSDNWQSLCATCHSGIKRMQERHGYSQACGVDGFPIDDGHSWNNK
jgi:5-methylcytosine-specific restriction protein A